MTIHFHVLASGSSGNACLLDLAGRGLLIDFGLGPRILANRLKECDYSLDQIRAVLLTHTHSDHCQADTLAHFVKRDIPIFAHADQVDCLQRLGSVYDDLQAGRLLRYYELDQPWEPIAGCRCRAFEVSHDAERTCGFRFDSTQDPWSLAYAADLGCWDEALVDRLVDVDLLALEFNHDVLMQRQSGRPYLLIRRVLGDQGHLSNDQACDLLRAVVERSQQVRLRHLVQLHLSRDCNRKKLARSAAKRLLAEMNSSCEVHTTQQGEVGPSLSLAWIRDRIRPTIRTEVYQQMLLPGWE